MPSTETSVADDELAAFVDRVLRMKSEEDAIKADIREIYAEAKGRGYDKTRLGEVVAHVRKVEKDANGEAEKEAIRDLYLTAYYRAKNKPHAHAYARGVESTTQNASVSRHDSAETGDLVTTPEHDPETGEITEPQSAPQAEQDGGAVSEVKGIARLENAVGVEPSPSTPIQPETANELPPASRGIAGEDDLRELAATVPGQIVREGDAPRETDRQEGNDDCQNDDDASRPDAELPIYAAPGVVTTEHTPPEPVKWHPYAQCFPTVLGDDLKALERDIHAAFGGVQQPIVKLGNLILDGRARYGIARSMLIDYPVVQYAGSDPLMDVIRWNLDSRSMTSGQITATAKALCKLEPTRADEIMQAFGLEVAEAAQ